MRRESRAVKRWFTAGIVLFIGVGFLLSAAGCAKTCTADEFRELVATTNRDTLGSVYYQGRKGSYDYFQLRWNLGRKTVRLNFSDSPIRKPFHYSSDESLWRAESFMHLEGVELKRAILRQFNE